MQKKLAMKKVNYVCQIFKTFWKKINLKMMKTLIYKISKVVLLQFLNFERKIHSEHNYQRVNNLILVI
jgi:hypothetical protein